MRLPAICAAVPIGANPHLPSITSPVRGCEGCMDCGWPNHPMALHPPAPEEWKTADADDSATGISYTEQLRAENFPP